MCYTTSWQNPSLNCAPTEGSYTRLLLRKANVNPADWTVTNTGTTRHTITAIAALSPSLTGWTEFFPDSTRDAQADDIQAAGGKGSFTHIITGAIVGSSFAAQRMIIDGQRCCGYIALVEIGGLWFAYGVNYDETTGRILSFAKLLPLAATTTGANREAEDAGTIMTFSRDKVTSARLCVDASVIGDLTITAYAA